MLQSIQEYLKKPYARILIPEEEGGYSAEILEFPGCFAEGETADEAMQALDRAAEAWIQAALDQGQEIPSPFRNQGYGGKIALRLPKSLHRQATEFAERDGTSLNQFLVSAIAARVGAEEFYNRLTTQVFEKLKDHLSTTTKGVTNIILVNLQSAPDQVAVTSVQQSQPTLSNLRFNRIVAKTSGDMAPAFLESEGAIHG
jgi:predicted RNase H-like HicB family nuclease